MNSNPNNDLACADKALADAVDSLIKQFSQSSQLSGGNAAFIEDLYEQYLLDPGSVGPKWQSYFDGFRGREAGDVPHSAVMAQVQRAAAVAKHATGGGIDEEAAGKQTAVGKLVTAYRSRGHLAARLDPLAMTPPEDAPDLGLAFHGLSEADLDREFAATTFFGSDAAQGSASVASGSALPSVAGSAGATKFKLRDLNVGIKKEGGKPATYKPLLLGVKAQFVLQFAFDRRAQKQGTETV